MAVDRSTFRPVLGDAVRLDAADTRHLNRLYELGLTSWLPTESVANGVYYGVRRGTRLLAAAGTHVISPTYGIAAVGNVYTNRDHRGQGLAKVVTSAVTAELLSMVDDVVLNVRIDNPPALAAYRALLENHRPDEIVVGGAVGRRQSGGGDDPASARRGLAAPGGGGAAHAGSADHGLRHAVP